MAAQVHGFQTEVSKLLTLLAKSLYSNKEVFLRELISNASDAVDKLRFLSITEPKLLGDDTAFAVRVKVDKDAKTLTVSDNGIGMTLEEANEHLGTIAKSGTADFLAGLSGDQAKDSQLIGQFGVGFYSAFIVADKVTVESRSAKAAPEEGVRWESTGEGTYTSETITRAERGTSITLHLKSDCEEFLDTWTVRTAITKYSDHISVPVMLWEEKYEEPDSENDKPVSTWQWSQVNDAKALWTLSPRDVTDDQYREFYKHLCHDFEEPLAWAHNRVEGELEYTSLLYLPSRAPWDLYTRDKVHGLKLFVQRVFIMDEAEQFLPNYLRFVRGLVDTNDLPLNVSRELLQESAVTQKLRKALTKRALGMIGKLSEDKDKYAVFWKNFGNVLKEGPVEDFGNREEVAKLLRFASTHNSSDVQDVSLADYISRMPEKQKCIYYLVSGSYAAASTSPYLESFKKKGIEVLLMWERIDEWLMGNMTEFEGKKFVPVTAADLDLGELEDKTPEKKEEQAKAAQPLVERFKKALGDKVTDVRVSDRLVESPSCVTGEHGQILTVQMRRMLEATGQQVPEEKFILEINPEHALVKKAGAADDAAFAKWAEFIYEEALLSEQGSLKDPNSFVRRLNELLLG
jgi:chaperone protein htpG